MLRAVSYNIHSGRDLFWRKRLEQMVRTLQALQPDVIGLQEVHQNSKYGYQAAHMAEQLGYAYVFAPSIPLADGYYGNALLTRFPVTSSQVMPLPAKREKRTLLTATVTWAGKEIAIWTTHCSLNQASRNSQLRRLTELTQAQRDIPRLLMGDFNSSTVSFAPDYVDCAMELGQASLYTIPAFRRRIDYIFASPHWEVCRYELSPVPWSDHLPVVADLRLHDA